MTLTTFLAAGLSLGGLSAAIAQTTVTYIVNERADIIGDPPRNVVFAEQYISKAMFEPLVFDFDGRTGESGIRPALATSWKIIDDNTWHFYLREGVTFHNGEPFNADAVKFSIERHLDPDFPSTDKFRDVPITAVNVIDEFTVEFVTETPVPILPERLSRNGAFIMAPGHYADLPLAEAAITPVGTGPYKLEEFRRDDRVILSKNETWWGWDDKSNIDRLVIRMIPELSTAFSEVMGGNADIVRISSDLADVVEAAPNVKLVVAPTLVRAVTIFNLDMYPQLQDPRVRVALNMAVDREAIVDAFAFGRHELISTTLINPPNVNPALSPYPYDPDRARELLAEAGYPNGFRIDTIDVMIPDSFEYSEAVAQYWAMVGVEVGEVRRLEASVMRERWAARTLSVASFLWSAAENTPETDAWAVHDDRQTNSTHWVRPDFLEAYREITQTVDPERRRELSYQMQDILYQDPPWVYLYLVPAAYAVSNRVEGYNPHPSLLVEDWGSLYVTE
ncbi:ABC transporter substrate-binding protein [Yoonia sp.]|uniref:ABC transporter substrate-binding protein n=1 Tax=Yoonia sp. TaxID=2212373 RepID=UPI003A4D20AB